MQDNTTTKGNKAEELAKNFLIEKGFSFITHQYRTRRGEIDLIMKNKKTLIFVEVRSRQHKSLVDPLETITWHKQQNIIYSAKVFMQYNPWTNDFEVRFDVICVYVNKLNCKITWIADAFRVE